MKHTQVAVLLFVQCMIVLAASMATTEVVRWGSNNLSFGAFLSSHVILIAENSCKVTGKFLGKC